MSEIYQLIEEPAPIRHTQIIDMNTSLYKRKRSDLYYIDHIDNIKYYCIILPDGTELRIIDDEQCLHNSYISNI